jgi:hypothetical protein
MRLLSSLAAIVLLEVALIPLACSTALAQAQPQPQVPTTVQLPTFSFFTVQTTVSVPDSGGAYLGGIGRAADGSRTRGIGPLKNRGLGSTRGASGISVHARIIDRHEMDQAVLAQAAAKRAGGAVRGTAGQAGSGAAFDSVAVIREQNIAAAAEKAREAAEYLAKAKQAEAEGKPGVAKIYYQMVVRRDAGSLKEQALGRLAAMDGGKSAAVATR